MRHSRLPMSAHREPAPEMVAVRLSVQARDGLRREAGRRQAEDGTEWTLSRVVEAILDDLADRRRDPVTVAALPPQP